MSIQKFIKDQLKEEETSPGPPTSEPHPTEPQSPDKSFTDFDIEHQSRICPGCSCLCDDVSYYLKEGRIVRTLNLCEIAMKRIHSVTGSDRLPPLPEDSLGENIGKAVQVLKDNGPPLILGADGLDESGIRASWKVARHLEGLWLSWAFPGMYRFFERVKRLGWAFALLDEVRDQSNKVIFWRADPLDTNHRHLSRYSFFPRGRYTERGNSDRNLTAVFDRDAVIQPLCQQYFQMDPSDDAAFIKALMGDPKVPEPEHRDFPMLLNALQNASHISIFTDPEAMHEDALDALFEWCASVNSGNLKRAVILPLWCAGANAEGFIQVSLELNGTGWGGDFAGITDHQDRIIDWEMIAEKVGSVLMFESAPEGAYRKRIPEPLSGKPLIVITPYKQEPLDQAEVVIPTALPGVEEGGLFLRADGLPLKTTKIEGLTTENYISTERVLLDILNLMGS